MSNRRNLLIALFLCMTMLACVFPGLASGSTPTPIVNAGELETMVAGTVAAAIEKTRRAVQISTQAPEDTPEPTPTQKARMAANTSLTPQNDGTILFLDDQAGYELNVPPGWLPVRIDQQEYYDAFSLPIAAEPAVQRALMDIKPLDPSVYRLFILDLQDGHLQKGIVTNVRLALDPAGTLSLDDDTDIKEAANSLPVSKPNLNVTSYSVSSTSGGIAIGTILSEINEKNLDGVDVVILQKQVYLNPPAGTLVITFTTEQDFKDATLSFFDAMIESIKIISG